MKTESMNACPGCKKHCPMGAPRCKYGRNYFEKAAAAQEKPLHRETHHEKGTKRHGWEKNVTQGSAVHRLISVGRSAKKALKQGRLTEAQLLASLSEEDRRALSEILELFERKNFGASGV